MTSPAIIASDRYTINDIFVFNTEASIEYCNLIDRVKTSKMEFIIQY
jgi:hypothetical protein